MSWLVPLEIGLTMGLVLAGAVLALAVAFRLLGFPDLTVEGSVPLGAACFAVIATAGCDPLLGMLGACMGGGICGALTAFIHSRFAVNKFLSGIIVVAISYSLILRLMGGSNIGLLQHPTLFSIVEPLDRWLGSRFHAGTLLLLSAVTGIIAVLLIAGLSSRRGVRLRAVGSNPDFAASLGISVGGNLVLGLSLTNAIAAFSGALLAMHQGFADVGMGQGILILALASMTIGERLIPTTTLPFHVFVVVAGILGSVAYQTLVAYAVRAGLAPTDLKLVTAILVLLVIIFRVTRDGSLVEERKE